MKTEISIKEGGTSTYTPFSPTEEIEVSADAKRLPFDGDRLDSEIDPFAARPGNKLSWKNLRMTVSGKNSAVGTKSIEILKGVSGTALPKQLLCILGHSGSGKTTLLNVLAGRLALYNQVSLEREITIDGIPVDCSSRQYKGKIAYTEQNDTLLSTATPREAIKFSARLRLPSTIDDKQIDKLTTKILRQIRLLSVADNIIGRPHHSSGLSGGEKRRVSLGTQLVVCPKLLFLDEVTSGLDSHNAFIVMQTCRHVAESGATVLMSIHQPNSKLFELMDRVYLMHEGRCMYDGTASLALSYFESRGYPKPSHYSPCDWMMEVSQTTDTAVLQEDGFFEENFSRTMVDVEKQDTDATEDASSLEDSREKANLVALPVHWHTEVYEQLVRDLKNLRRDHEALMFRFIMVAVGTALVAFTFQGIGENSLEDPVSFQSHIGALFFIVLGSMIILQMVLLEFVEVRSLYIKEMASRHYGIFTFGLTKFLMEGWTTFLQVMVFAVIIYWALPFSAPFGQVVLIQYVFTMIGVSISILVGASTKDPRTAKEFLPLVMTPQILFAGFFVAVEAIPVWLRWLHALMPSTYVWRLYLASEFSVCLEGADASLTVSFCREYLEIQNATGAENAQYWCILLVMFVGCRIASLYILSRKVKHW